MPLGWTELWSHEMCPSLWCEKRPLKVRREGEGLRCLGRQATVPVSACNSKAETYVIQGLTIGGIIQGYNIGIMENDMETTMQGCLVAVTTRNAHEASFQSELELMIC